MPKGSKKELPEKKVCVTCQKEKRLIDFYLSSSPLHSDQRIPTCKTCLTSLFDNNNQEESLKNILRQIDKPYIPHLLDAARNENPNNVFGSYMKNIQSMTKYKGWTWKDSQLNKEIEEIKTEKIEQFDNDTGYTIEELKEKYGYGYPDDEYYLFEKKYQQLRSSFQLVTTMHEEYFREYCINKVKETLAKARGDFKEAKEWAGMVKDVAEAGKLKPSQMSKADLSGGLDTFGQLARMVEENYEIMPLLPRFTERPKDKVDVVLWCFINYVRDLKGLPACDYKEIYEFYNKRKLEYESQMSDNEYSNDEEVDMNA